MELHLGGHSLGISEAQIFLAAPLGWVVSSGFGYLFFSGILCGFDPVFRSYGGCEFSIKTASFEVQTFILGHIWSIVNITFWFEALRASSLLVILLRS